MTNSLVRRLVGSLLLATVAFSSPGFAHGSGEHGVVRRGSGRHIMGRGSAVALFGGCVIGLALGCGPSKAPSEGERLTPPRGIRPPWREPLIPEQRRGPERKRRPLPA